MALDSNILAQSFSDKLAAAYSARHNNMPLPDIGTADRQMLFRALAEAIVEHIQTRLDVEITNVGTGVFTKKGVIS